MPQLRFSKIPSESDTDLAIIGGGISALYCAWRLVQADEKLRIVIVERLNRTGGRLDSDIVRINGDRVREEQGGMRFNYNMSALMNLIKGLDLCDQIVPFPMSSEGNTNRYNVRGHSFTVAETLASDNLIWSELYDLDPEEQGLSPTELVTTAYHNVLQANGDLDPASRQDQTPDFWTTFRETYRWQGKTMNQWQLWALLRSMGYSQECVEMLSQTIGFAGPFKSMANAGDAFQILADFPKDPTYFTFERGFSTLPNAIRRQLRHKYGDRVQIWLSTNVDSVAKPGDSFELSLTKAPFGHNAVPRVPCGEHKTLRANKLVVAIATKSAEQLFLTSPAFREHPDAAKLWENIHASMGMKLMKINLYFNNPWWTNSDPSEVSGLTNRPPVQFGPNFTNLPLNAAYPFYALEKDQAEDEDEVEGDEDQGEDAGSGSDDDDDDSGIDDTAAAALTIYCDFTNTNFWHGLQNIGPMFESRLQRRENRRPRQRIWGASQAVVDEARRQLQRLFGTNWVPEPVLTSYRLWDGEQDFEYAYHQWRLNVVDSEVRAYLSAPIEGVYFCNEAISDMQGWVEGSLRSTNLVLEHFGLGPMADDPCKDPNSDAGDDASSAKPTLRLVTGLWA